jgi:hypothetical protein
MLLMDIKDKFYIKTFGKIPQGFIIDIEPNEFDNIVGKDNVIFKNTKTCYCWNNYENYNSEFIHIQKKGNINIKDVIQYLIDINYDTECNHQFLERIDKTPNSDVQIEAFLVVNLRNKRT